MLKREVRYGIIGDASISIANPSSQLMRINKTHREFIKSSEYSQEDKDLLMLIFESGDKLVNDIDKIDALMKS